MGDINQPDTLELPESQERWLGNVSQFSDTSQGHSSLDVNASEMPFGGGTGWLHGLSPLSLPLSAPATPPRDRNSEGSQLMNGIGCLFPHILLPRASTLTVDSEPTEAPVTPSPGRAAEPDVLDTPRISVAATFQTPTTLVVSARGTIFGHLANPLTPSPTPARKRALSTPPSAPRPKRSRLQSWEGDDRSEDEGYSEAYFPEVSSNQSLSQIRQRTIDLAVSAGVDVPVVHTAVFDDSEKNLPLRTTPDAPAYPDHNHKFRLTIEWFPEEDIEGQLCVLLKAYRAFYLEPDEKDSPKGHPSPKADPEEARIARQTFKAIFENHLNSAEDEIFLLQEEEEDVLDVFATWIREMKLQQSDVCNETLEDMSDCLNRVAGLSVAPFIRKIVLSARPGHGEVLVAWLPGVDVGGVGAPNCTADGSLEWEFDRIFRGFEHLRF
ncbi:hypothetical protein QBC35DRAFT_449295 [Podospora australis]|uniref:Uncharacterized protein n=1 Tax=Podospora australis TaxID=1536484 RepID=A0AAN6X1X4_9PEZI|nr:hypothetical protein QBC35DRAFT_449295 [Podospora australis]